MDGVGETVGVEVDEGGVEPVARAVESMTTLGQRPAQPVQMGLQRGAGSRGGSMGHSASTAASAVTAAAAVEHEQGEQPALQASVGRDVVTVDPDADRARARRSAVAPRSPRANARAGVGSGWAWVASIVEGV